MADELIFISPSNGAIVPRDEYTTVEVKAAPDYVGLITDIIVTVGGKTLFTMTAASAQGGGSAGWMVPRAPHHEYTLTASGTNAAGQPTSSTITVTSEG